MQNSLNVANPRKGIVGYARKSNPRQEYRLNQRERIEASPVLAKQFPGLKRLTVALEYYDASGETRQGAMKCTLNVEHARSMLWFACPAVDCLCGDFDLSAALATAVATRRKVAAGEVRCQGERKRGDRERVPCRTLLRYKLHLIYD
jgi:hypothetical protein